jgi:hypothetical protein
VTNQDSATTQAVVNALLASGFPFQTAITELVRSTPNWTVAREEFPWRDETGSDRFLDLVVERPDLIVTIECKKTQKEILTFLLPDGAPHESVNRSRCLYLHQIQDSTRRLELFCGDWDFKPKSPESAFCVVSTSDSGKDQRLLEKDAQLLIAGADAFGRYLRPEQKTSLGEPNRAIVPAIVTNAKLFTANYTPSSVSLETGQLPIMPGPAISSIEWIRFRKAFSAREPAPGERTVFVIAANSLQKFLEALDDIAPQREPQNRVHIARS